MCVGVPAVLPRAGRVRGCGILDGTPPLSFLSAQPGAVPPRWTLGPNALPFGGQEVGSPINLLDFCVSSPSSVLCPDLQLVPRDGSLLRAPDPRPGPSGAAPLWHRSGFSGQPTGHVASVCLGTCTGYGSSRFCVCYPYAADTRTSFRLFILPTDPLSFTTVCNVHRLVQMGRGYGQTLRGGVAIDVRGKEVRLLEP